MLKTGQCVVEGVFKVTNPKVPTTEEEVPDVDGCGRWEMSSVK